VIGAVGGAVLVNTAIRAVVDRPLTEAEIQALPQLSTVHHPFPSGHVVGIGALLGMIAVCIAVGPSRIVQALLTVLVVAGMVIVAVSRFTSDIGSGVPPPVSALPVPAYSSRRALPITVSHHEPLTAAYRSCILTE